MPKVWNKRDPNVPKDAVYVGRPSKWGNPFVIGGQHPHNPKHKMTREDVVSMYHLWFTQEGRGNLYDISELRGKDLVCWCSPKPCHADVLLEIANEKT